MMIEVNLLPGSGRKGGRKSAGVPLGQRLAAWRASVRDPYLAAAVVMLIGVSAGVGALHASQTRAATDAAAREEIALRDSARLSTVIAARKRALAERDSVERELAIIAAIDSNRYVWAHVLDEVSQALPPYTWVTSVTQTSAPPAPPPTRKQKADSAAAAAERPATRADSAADSLKARGPMHFKVVGQTVDIQALTRFMRDLEASPFVQNVQLQKSEAVLVDGKDVTEFTLEAKFEPAPRAQLRTRSITVPVR